MGCTNNGVSFDDTERAFVFNGAADSSLSLTNPVGNVFSVSFDVRYTGGCSGAPSHWPRGCGLLAAEATSDREYYLGCFSHYLTTDDIVVSNFDECRSECAGRGHAYCALQEGSRCFCTDSYGGVIVVPSPEAECPESCGGALACLSTCASSAWPRLTCPPAPLLRSARHLRRLK